MCSRHRTQTSVNNVIDGVRTILKQIKLYGSKSQTLTLQEQK